MVSFKALTGLATILLSTFSTEAKVHSRAKISPNNNIVQNAVSIPELSTLVSVVSLPSYAPILDALSTVQGLTLFAPSNAAFAAANIDVNNVALVTAVLQYHVLPIVAPSTALAPLQFVPTLLNGTDFVNWGARGAAQLEIAASAAGVKITHGIPSVDTASVTTADVFSSNGVIHIIDQVLIVPSSPSATATKAGLSSLVGALVQTNLAGVVDNATDTTIFAPTNDAFAAANLAGLDVANILESHVVPAAVFSSELKNGQVVKTLSGRSIKITIRNGSVFVNNAKVIIADVLTNRGAVHVIDSVLFAPTKSTHRKSHH